MEKLRVMMGLVGLMAHEEQWVVNGYRVVPVKEASCKGKCVRHSCVFEGRELEFSPQYVYGEMVID